MSDHNITVRPATAADEVQLQAQFPQLEIKAVSGFSQRHIAVDSTSGQILGTVTVALPGEHLNEATSPGQLDFAEVHTVHNTEAVTAAVVRHVIDLARKRYAAEAVTKLRQADPALRAVLDSAGFRPLSDPNQGGYGIDLTIDDDGTATRLLNNPALAALNSLHSRFAQRRGEVARYQPDVSPWTGIPDDPSPRDWNDLATLVGFGATVSISSAHLDPPEDWILEGGGNGVQMIGEAVVARPDPEVIQLTAEDVPEILDHIERTKPGPFRPRTIELGNYLGIRDQGRLVAVAGERLHPPGWTEISAVSTDPEFRGRGLARRLVLAVAHVIQARGETPFLHASATNTNAIRLYEQLGFRLRKQTKFRAFTVPGR